MTQYFTKKDDGEFEEAKAISQDTFDTKVEERLARQAKQFEGYDDFKQKAEKAEELKSDYETKLKEATDKATEFEGKLKTANLETDRVRVIGKYKLSDELAEFVTGDNKDEMEKRAEKLSKNIKSGTTIDKTGKPKGDGTDSVNKSLASNLFGKNSD